MDESKATKLLIEYYENREELRLIANKISKATFVNIDLSGFRDEWYGVDYKDGWCEAYNAEWKGWVGAVSNAEDGYSQEEMDLAKLLDEKKRIVGDCGEIKRKIYRAGKICAKQMTSTEKGE